MNARRYILLAAILTTVGFFSLLAVTVRDSAARPVPWPTPKVVTVFVPVGAEWTTADAVCAKQRGGRAIGIEWAAFEPNGRDITCADGKTWAVEDGRLTDVTVKS